LKADARANIVNKTELIFDKLFGFHKIKFFVFRIFHSLHQKSEAAFVVLVLALKLNLFPL